jgi:hypothetical protein
MPILILKKIKARLILGGINWAFLGKNDFYTEGSPKPGAFYFLDDKTAVNAVKDGSADDGFKK